MNTTRDPKMPGTRNKVNPHSSTNTPKPIPEIETKIQNTMNHSVKIQQLLDEFELQCSLSNFLFKIRLSCGVGHHDSVVMVVAVEISFIRELGGLRVRTYDLRIVMERG
ncbi:hypothetical protein Droror1_Dr00003068 [Drosera rotundifolia]